MTRGDVRLLAVIVVTSAITSVMTVTVTRLLSTERARAPSAPVRVAEVVPVEPPRAVPIVPVEPSLAPEVAPTDPTQCDEVSCVLNNYEASCCARYRRPKLGDPALPDGLDRALISEGVAAVKQRILACGARSSATGMVKVAVRVSPEGLPTTVTIKSTPDAALGECVRTGMTRARFVRTNNGGSFAYPFVF